MIRKVVLFASLSILASCATPSGPLPPPAAEPAPAACDPRLSAAIPEIPDAPAGASIVAPVTLDERVATALHLSWVAELVDVAGQLRARAILARAACGRVVGNPPP